MLNNKDIQAEETKVKKKRNISLRIIIFLILIILVGSSVFYFFYRDTEAKRVKYNLSLQEVEKLHKEKDRCSQILGQGSGDFKDYDYCRQLMQVFPKQ